MLNVYPISLFFIISFTHKFTMTPALYLPFDQNYTLETSKFEDGSLKVSRTMKTTLSDINYDEIVYENKDSNGEIHNIEARTSKMIYLDLFGDLYGKERSYICHGDEMRELSDEE